MSNEINLDEFLDNIVEALADKLVKKSRIGKMREEIKELERTNHELIAKNKVLLQENENLRYWYEKQGEDIKKIRQEKEHLQNVCNDLREKLIERYQKKILNEDNKANEDILFYQEQNRKLLESNKSLVEEIEKLKKQNKELLLQNIELDGKLKEIDKLRDID